MSRRMADRCAVVTLLAMGLVAAAGCGGAEARKAKYVEHGRQLMAERDFTKARLEFRNALQIDPKDAAVRELVGVTSEKLGEYDDAVRAYRVALAADETRVIARARLARLMAVAGLADEAMDLVEPGLKLAPQSAALISVRGVIHGQRGDLAAARKDAELAYELDPQDPEVAATLAATMWEAGEREDAIKLIDAAIGQSPDNLELRLLQGRLLVAVGRTREAEGQFAEVVRLEPSNVQYRNALGQVYLRQGKTDQAIEVARQAVAAAPASVEAKLMLVQLLASYRSFDEAEQQLKEFGERAPKDLDLQLGIGRFYEANRRDALAEETYKRVIDEADSRPQGQVARTRLAMLKLRGGRTDEALQLANEVLRDDPAAPGALVVRAEIAMSRGEAAAAVTDLRAAMANQPDSVPLAVALSKAHVQAGERELAEQVLRSVVQASPRSTEARLALAQFLIDSGKQRQAAPVLEQLLSESQGDARSLESLLKLQIATRDIDGALESALAIQVAQPDSPKGYLLEGQVRQETGNNTEARAAYERAAAAAPDATEPVVALVAVDLAENKPEQALARLDEAIRAHPTNAFLHAMRGDVLLRLRRPADAVPSYAEAVKLVPDLPQFYRGLAVAYIGAGQKEKGIDALKRGLEVTQSLVVAGDLAAVYVDLGRVDDAVQTYEAILAKNPADNVAANNLAMILVTRRSDERSLARARTLVQRFETSRVPAYLDTYGWVLYKAGEYEAAAAALQQAVDKAPGSRELRYHLGMAQLKLGQKDKARENLTLAVAEGRPYTGLDEAKTALASL